MAFPASEVIIGTVHINGGTKGFTEKVCLINHTGLTPAAVADHKLICDARRCLMPDGFVMEWAKLTAADNMRNRKASIDGELLPLGDGSVDATTQLYGKCNNIQNALLFSGETADGRFASEHIKGVPDGRIVDDVITFTYTPLAVPVAPPTAFVVAPGAGSSTWVEDLRNYIAILKDKTCHLRKLPDGTYEKTAWEKFIFRRVASLYIGAPFDTSLRRL